MRSMGVAKLLSEGPELKLIVCDVLSGLLKLQHDEIVCVRVAFMLLISTEN